MRGQGSSGRRGVQSKNQRRGGEFDDIEGDSPDRGTLDLDDILVEQSMKKKGSLDQNGMKRVRGSNNRAKYSK